MARKDFVNGHAIPIPVDPVKGIGQEVPPSSVVTGKDPATSGQIYQIAATAVYAKPGSQSDGTAVSSRYYTIQNADGRTGFLLHRSDTGSNDLAITLETYYQHDNLDMADKVITMGAGDIVVFGRLSPSVYNHPDGTVRLYVSTLQASSTVNVYAFTI